jgi:asparagine synthase (glutamine-hydrolysing)
MCGIGGGYGDLTGLQPEAMPRAMGHRGPDDEGESRISLADARSVYLASRRLAILDLTERGRQPMSTPDGRFTIAYNGEIYNFRQVAKELRDSGVPFESDSDTEVVLKAWARWGPSCMERLQGMFAFAVFDREQGRLFIARDRLGEKPLYYWTNGRATMFASEVRALLAAGVPRALSRDGLDSYLTFGSVCDPYTLIQDVYQLRPGHYAEVTPSRIDARVYWSLQEIDEDDRESLATKSISELLTEGCIHAMESDVPVGVLLSGGIDSSTIVALLSSSGYGDLRTFNVVFPAVDRSLDERRWADLVAARYKTDHRSVEVTLKQAFSWASEAVAAMDQPSIDGVNTFIVTKAIREAGLKVALSGLGSDELFLGYSNGSRFSRFARVAGVGMPGSRALVEQSARMFGRQRLKVERLSQLMGTNRNKEAAAYVACRSLYSQAALERLTNDRRPPQTRFVQRQGGTTQEGILSRLELGHYLRNTLLKDSDQMSMANSVELRQPFLHTPLLERVVRLPSSVKMRPGEQKPMLVDSVRHLLPAAIIERPKIGFQLPIDRWMREGLEVSRPTEMRGELFSKHEIESVRNDFLQGGYYAPLWALQVLAAWLERHRVS